MIVLKNIMMLYGMSIAKIIFPLLTLPYLTRVLTVESYGVVSYIKALMQYMQIVVDFGFMLSGTKDIVNAKNNHDKLEKEVGDILLARVFIAGLAFIVLLGMTIVIPTLRANATYTILSYANVFLSVFLYDYFFRGIEKMQIITERFIVMRAISTVMTFVLVHSEADVFLIPILDIVGSLVAVILVHYELKKENISFQFTGFNSIYRKLKKSAVYFISSMASTVYGALNTLLIGIFLSSHEVAYWSVCTQLIGAVQTMYLPITDGIYPEMIKRRSWKFIKRLLLCFMPIILAGSVFSEIVAPYVLLIMGGKQYIGATPLFRILIPVLFFSFPSGVLGWPTLGAIEREINVTKTTTIASCIQIVGLLVLILTDHFTIIWIARLRCLVELMLLLGRMMYCWKYRTEFHD